MRGVSGKVPRQTGLSRCFTSQGQIQVEPQEEARKRGFQSPDHAEAEVMASCRVVPRERRLVLGGHYQISPIRNNAAPGGCMTRAAILALCTLSFASAQDVTGEWVGTPQSSDVWSGAGTTNSATQKLVLNLAGDRQGAWACTIYSGRNGSGAIPCTSLVVNRARVTFAMTGGRFPMSFIGKLSADGKSIAGVLLRGKEHISLEFDRIGRPPVATPSPATTPATTTGSRTLRSSGRGTPKTLRTGLAL
jgi:hypothetical protein